MSTGYVMVTPIDSTLTEEQYEALCRTAEVAGHEARRNGAVVYLRGPNVQDGANTVTYRRHASGTLTATLNE